MSVWASPCYKGYTFQSVATRVSEEHLNCPFVLKLLDYSVEHYGDFPVPKGVKAGNLREQVEAGHVKITDIISSEPPVYGVIEEWDSEEGIDRTLEGNFEQVFARAQDRLKTAARRLELKEGAGSVRRVCFNTKTNFRQRSEEDIGFSRFIGTLPEPAFGLAGVYRFVGNYFGSQRVQYADECKGEFVGALRSAIEAGLGASYCSPGTARNYAERYASNLQRDFESVAGFVRKVIAAATYSGTRSAKRAHNATPNATDNYEEVPASKTLKGFATWSMFNLLILQDNNTSDVYVFTEQDVERLRRIWYGLGVYKLYLSHYGSGDAPSEFHEQLIRSGDRMINHLLHSFRHVTQESANRLCRLYDIYFHYQLALHAIDINQNALHLQEAKLYDEDPNDHLCKSVLTDILSVHKLKERLELLYIYKCLPTPDFCGMSMMEKQRVMYETEQRPNYGVETPLTGTFQSAKNYQKWLMIYCFYKKHKLCPGTIQNPDQAHQWQTMYPYIDPHVIPTDMVGVIDIHGAFDFHSYGKDVMDATKDKAICPLNISMVKNQHDLGNIEGEEKNQLLDVMSRVTALDTDQLKTNYDNLFFDIKCEDKPEAKKPAGRVFMEAHTDVRILQSEYEKNIERFAHHAPGYMAGKSFNDVVKLTNHLYEPHQPGQATIPILISFDLSKFSPGMPLANHQFLDNLWSNAFGIPIIQQYHKLFTEGDMHYIRDTIHHTMRKPGRDFEGFAGKKLTFFHIGVMGYAVKRLKLLGYIKGYGRFATLIDDGILRLDVDITDYKQTVSNILEVIEQVYGMWGLLISWDKTFVSSYMSIFLHNIRWQNVCVSPGFRAACKLTNRSEVAIPSILDDLEILNATLRGAYTAGSPPLALYGLYIWLIFDTYRKWKAPLYALSATAWLFAPKMLGGGQTQTLLELLGTVAGDPLTEGIGVLRSIATRFKNQRVVCNNIIRVTAERPNGIVRMKLPHLLDTGRAVFKQDRLARRVGHALSNLLEYTDFLPWKDGPVDAYTIYATIDWDRPPPAPTLIDLWESTTDAAIDRIAQKFLKARTVSRMLSYGQRRRVIYANRSDIQRVTRQWHYVDMCVFTGVR